MCVCVCGVSSVEVSFGSILISFVMFGFYSAIYVVVCRLKRIFRCMCGRGHTRVARDF